MEAIMESWVTRMEDPADQKTVLLVEDDEISGQVEEPRMPSLWCNRAWLTYPVQRIAWLRMV